MSEETREDLLRRARELGEKADEARHETGDNHSSAAERLVRDNAFFRKLSALADRIGNAMGAVGTVLGWILRMLVKWLRWVSIEPENPDVPGSGGFSSGRSVRNLFLSVVAIVGLHVIWSAIYFYGTYFEETVYVTGKQEIITGELYQFGGCTSLPCSTESDNGKFYLIESSLYFPVMLYPEENVFANVPQFDAACNVEGYGIYFRTLRWIYKTLQLYQHVVDVSCRPYTEEEVRRAVLEGEIVRDPVPD